MVSDKKLRLLEIAKEEGALTLDYGLEVYSSTSNVSRAVRELVDNDLINKKEAPKISNYRKVWTLTDKGEMRLSSYDMDISNSEK